MKFGMGFKEGDDLLYRHLFPVFTGEEICNLIYASVAIRPE